MNIHIIGAGGVGSWLTPALAMLAKPDSITVMDGDRLEEKNLNRQLFSRAQIGQHKAESLARIYGVRFDNRWYSFGRITHTKFDLLMVAVDNNAARMAALRSCDATGCHAIIMANERTSAEACYYQPAWQDTFRDPRVRTPEMVTDPNNDPRAAVIGCTGEAQEETPQLASANFMAAALGLKLYVLWFMEMKSLDQAVIPFLPYLILSNLSGQEQFVVGEK
jgi:hypothetical protein